MKEGRNHAGWLSITGLILLLLVARWLDVFAAYARRHMALAHPPFDAILWVPALSSLLLAALLLLLAWFVLSRAPRNPWIAGVYVVVGLFLAFSRLLYFVPVVSGWVPAALYTPLSSPASYAALTGSFIAGMGLFMLILPRSGGT